MKKKFLFTIFSTFIISSSFGQGIIKNTVTNKKNVPLVSCGSHDLLLKLDKSVPGTLNTSNEFLEGVQDKYHLSHSRSSNEVYRIPVVFHVLYNDVSEDLPDLVLEQQLDVLNESFRRENADTINMRTDFSGLVGDSKIEFYLATIDPSGNVTNGMIHKQTSITNFGGVLPYSASQTLQIQKWVSDSLIYNYFRMTKDSLGGDDAWDTTQYLNIWIGNMTVLEPLINNVEELVYFGLSTPPVAHANWPAATLEEFAGYGDGTLMHYQAIGPNNPVPFLAPYLFYNGKANTGKMLVHEVGHYLGLRHIWGDGNCTKDDYVSDTPRMNASSQYNCNLNSNSCMDTINGVNLPNMVENYMDYSEGDCQNSFTKGQVAVMRATIENFRSDLCITSITENEFSSGEIKLFPNPTTNHVNIEFEQVWDNCILQVIGVTGSVISTEKLNQVQNTSVALPNTPGVYFVRVTTNAKMMTFKVVKE